MKKCRLKYFILFVFLMFLGCVGEKELTNNVTFGSSMKVSYTMVANSMQIDSICEVDTLPNIITWKSMTFNDFETNTPYTKRLYIKDKNKDSEIIYILLGENEPYVITRRITY